MGGAAGVSTPWRTTSSIFPVSSQSSPKSECHVGAIKTGIRRPFGVVTANTQSIVLFLWFSTEIYTQTCNWFIWNNTFSRPSLVWERSPLTFQEGLERLCISGAVFVVVAEEEDLQGNSHYPFPPGKLIYPLWFTGMGMLFLCFYTAIWPSCSLLRNLGLDQVQFR